MATERRANRLPFSSDVVFEYVMRDPEIARRVTEAALGVKIERVVRHETQDVESPDVATKSVRLDVLLKDGETVYDVEMQTTRQLDLGLRLRGYQSIIDASELARGSRFGDLKRSFIVFICCFDPFKAGLPAYTFMPKCAELPGVNLDTRQSWVLLNAAAWAADAPGDRRDLLEYVTTGKCGNPLQSDLVKRIETAVERANSSMWGENMITLEQKRVYEREAAEAEGMALGKAEGKAEGEERLAELVRLLIEKGRSDQLDQALTDADARAKLMAEYGIE